MIRHYLGVALRALFAHKLVSFINLAGLAVRLASVIMIGLCIAWVTVGGTAAKAASTKPVLALRYE